jgi:hypothetical protein
VNANDRHMIGHLRNMRERAQHEAQEFEKSAARQRQIVEDCDIAIKAIEDHAKPDPEAPVTFAPAPDEQAAKCNDWLRAHGATVLPRSCRLCGLGPCSREAAK